MVLALIGLDLLFGGATTWYFVGRVVKGVISGGLVLSLPVVVVGWTLPEGVRTRSPLREPIPGTG